MESTTNIEENIHKGAFGLYLDTGLIIPDTEWYGKITKFYIGQPEMFSSNGLKFGYPVEPTYSSIDIGKESIVKYEQSNKRHKQGNNYWTTKCEISFIGNNNKHLFLSPPSPVQYIWFLKSIYIMETNGEDFNHRKIKPSYKLELLQPNGEFIDFEFGELIKQTQRVDYVFSISMIVQLIIFSRKFIHKISNFATIDDFKKSNIEAEIVLKLD